MAFFKEIADIRYLSTSLFSQIVRARLCERVGFEKTNSCVNNVQEQTEIFLKFKANYQIAFTVIYVVLKAF